MLNMDSIQLGKIFKSKYFEVQLVTAVQSSAYQA